jgi:fido (protein-threonine AMPylation protein)
MVTQSKQPTPAQKVLADALTALRALQQRGGMVVQTADLSRPHREALQHAGFLQTIIGGWYMSTHPGDEPGDTTPWMASMKEFIAAYANVRFGDKWCVSAEFSLQLHSGSTLLPRQVVVHSPAASNGNLLLPCGYSLLAYKAKDFPDPAAIDLDDKLRKMNVAEALVRVSPTFFEKYPLDAQVALQSLPDVSDLSRRLLAGGNSVVAGRLAGALRAIGKAYMADEVVAVMQSAGYKVIETNPFDTPPVPLLDDRAQQPHVIRMISQWALMREQVMATFQLAAGKVTDIEATMQQVEANYVTDAYHSLSIEGYRVTEELIRRVATGDWSPDAHADDQNSTNAMAAHGYWLAHNAVKDSIRKILTGANPGTVLKTDHALWYRKLFEPAVTAGILPVSALAGYRTHPVYIQKALHVPPSKDKVRDMMPVFFDLLQNEPDAAVRAVLGHYMFVYIHPYMDGNGRMGRFLMNAMLAAAGFPWTVVRLQQRDAYMAALNSASGEGNIVPFAEFISACTQSMLPS